MIWSRSFRALSSSERFTGPKLRTPPPILAARQITLTETIRQPSQLLV